jgi:hypothetical protein
MLQDQQFRIRLSVDDREKLVSVAKHFQRSQADTIKVLVREVYQMIQAEKVEDPKPTQQPAAVL